MRLVILATAHGPQLLEPVMQKVGLSIAAVLVLVLHSFIGCCNPKNEWHPAWFTFKGLKILPVHADHLVRFCGQVIVFSGGHWKSRFLLRLFPGSMCE